MRGALLRRTPSGGDGTAQLLERDAVEDLRVSAAMLRRARARANFRAGGAPGSRAASRTRARSPAGPGSTAGGAGPSRARRRTCPAGAASPPARRSRPGVIASPEEGEPEVKRQERATRMRGRERLERLDGPVGPAREAEPTCASRRGIGRRSPPLSRPACLCRAAGPAEARAPGIGAQAEVELERRLPGARLRGAATAPSREHAEHDHTRSDNRREGDAGKTRDPAAHGATIPRAWRPPWLPAIQLEA